MQQDEFTLTADQSNALEQFVAFLLNPNETVFVLEGYSGTGKSTLIKTLFERLDGYIKMAKLIDEDYKVLPVQLTATTNKAAEAFAQASGQEVITIHSFLGLRVNTDYKSGVTTLIPRNGSEVSDTLIFIDEASYVDSQLLGLIFTQTKRCKVVFIGDRAQLSPVKSTNTPVFEAKFPGAMLKEPVRQAEGSPINVLATQFRETVNTGVWTPFKPDGESVIHLPRGDFEDAILAEFTRPNWRHRDSKVLGWTNKCVLAYNHAISSHVSGVPHFQVGDYAVCNKFVQVGKQSIKTDQMVYITAIEEDAEELGVKGKWVTLDYLHHCFFPNSPEEKALRVKKAKAADDFMALRRIGDTWIDLRQAFAQTINKSQGSTYDRVYIDLDDLRRCNSGDQIARMMYVGVSRARLQVFMTGDFA